MLGQARKTFVENGDDFLNDGFFLGPVTLRIALLQAGPELVAGRQPDCHDGRAFRAERGIGAKRLHFQTVVPRLIVHAERLGQGQIESVRRIRENFLYSQ